MMDDFTMTANPESHKKTKTEIMKMMINVYSFSTKNTCSSNELFELPKNRTPNFIYQIHKNCGTIWLVLLVDYCMPSSVFTCCGILLIYIFLLLQKCFVRRKREIYRFFNRGRGFVTEKTNFVRFDILILPTKTQFCLQAQFYFGTRLTSQRQSALI